MIMGIDHGYYAIKTRHFSFPAGVTAYTHEPYTLKNTLQIGGKYYVCGTGRQPILRDKTVNDNYYILTLAAIAMELRCRGLPAENSVTLAAGLPLARYGRDKKPFTEYLLRNGQPVSFLFEGERYKVKIESVKLFPQGYSAMVSLEAVMNAVAHGKVDEAALYDHDAGYEECLAEILLEELCEELRNWKPWAMDMLQIYMKNGAEICAVKFANRYAVGESTARRYVRQSDSGSRHSSRAEYSAYPIFMFRPTTSPRAVH